jgi:hypothetical protein
MLAALLSALTRHFSISAVARPSGIFAESGWGTRDLADYYRLGRGYVGDWDRCYVGVLCAKINSGDRD